MNASELDFAQHGIHFNNLILISLRFKIETAASLISVVFTPFRGTFVANFPTCDSRVGVRIEDKP